MKLIISVLVIFAFATSAEARPRHYGQTIYDRHGVTQYVSDHVSRVRHVSRPRVTRKSIGKTAPAPAPIPASTASSSSVIVEARRWLGTNPTDRKSLWCARFMNFVLARTGYSGTGSDAARSFATYGQRVSGPQVGAIAVMTRGQNGGHVGIVSGFAPSGNPIIISGNHGHKVAETVYPRGRIYAYVLPHGKIVEQQDANHE